MDKSFHYLYLCNPYVVNRGFLAIKNVLKIGVEVRTYSLFVKLCSKFIEKSNPQFPENVGRNSIKN